MTETTNYAILFQGRTGSSFLVDSLTNHSQVDSNGEIFAYAMGTVHGRLLNSSTWKRTLQMAQLGRMGSPPDLQSANVAKIFDNPDRSPVVGFKTKIRDIIDPEAFKEQCEAANCKFIVMERKNLLKQAVSHINAERLFHKTKASSGKGDWNLRNEKDRLAPEPIPPAVLDRALKFVAFDQAMLEAFAEFVDGPKLHLEYADLLADQDAWFGTVFDFLGVAPEDLKSTFKKNTKDDLRSAIPNFDELRERYADTAYAKMFDEVTTA